MFKPLLLKVANNHYSLNLEYTFIQSHLGVGMQRKYKYLTLWFAPAAGSTTTLINEIKLGLTQDIHGTRSYNVSC